MGPKDQLFAIVGDLKWIIAIAFVISLGLFLPDQVREIYRIAAGEGGLTIAKQFIAVIAIGLFIWFGAFQVATETGQRIGPLKGYARSLHRWLPIALGVLPILAVTAAQLASIPERLDSTETVYREVGSVLRIQRGALELDGRVLAVCFALVASIAVLFVATLARTQDRLRQFAIAANVRYFEPSWFLLLTFGLILCLTFVFVRFPDTPAQILGSVGVVALFTLCLVLFAIHVSLLTIKYRFPFFLLIIVFAAAVALLGTNDNHHVRQPATPSKESALRGSAADAFAKWLTVPGRVSGTRTDPFPVFVVSAQGGGLYAAQNAAIFLARMQDLCPAFRQHLFAVSSVSGGSIGAAVFAAALRSAEEAPSGKRAPDPVVCPRIARFLSNLGVSNIDEPGEVERRVHLALKSDFLSPLIAASLFPDFTQAFLPFPVGAFDRARALEYSLESAAAEMDKLEKGEGSPAAKLLGSDYREHWSATNGMPALLLNTTDAGSGKRVVIAPFDIDPQHPIDSDLCTLADLVYTPVPFEKKGVQTSSSLALPLSTAAFISARFPWVTPAATVTVKNKCISRKHEKARLVDGGYIDNSGVETALDLIEQLEAVAKSGRPGLPNFKIYHISLTGGDFPDHGPFYLGELLEPIRALLSGRTSRAYIALNRAALQDRVATGAASKASGSVFEISASAQRGERPAFKSFTRSDLQNHFYDLPLGWSLSEQTRNVVSLNSGRFWDCDHDHTFSQSRKLFSNADCAQIKVYHLINDSRVAALQRFEEELEVRRKLAGSSPALSVLAKAGKDKGDAEAQVIGKQLEQRLATAQVQKEKPKEKPKIDREALLACYEQDWVQDRRYKRYLARYNEWAARADKDKPERFDPYREPYLAYYQTAHIRALLDEWEASPELDHRTLAYLIGSISYDSADFVLTTENLSFSTERSIPRKYRARIEEINRNLAKAGKPRVEIQTLLNDPRRFANLVWGFDGNDFKNDQPDDGWHFRPRGIYQIIGKWHYSRLRGPFLQLYPELALDITKFPDALWNTRISAKVAFTHFASFTYTAAGRPQTLFELAKGDRSFSEIRALQWDMDRSENARAEVGERSKVLLACIERASQPVSEGVDLAGIASEAMRVVRRFLGEQSVFATK